jgi:hypothetical protein
MPAKKVDPIRLGSPPCQATVTSSLANIVSQHLVAHPEVAAGIEKFLVKKEGVGAAEVADRACRLGQHMNPRCCGLIGHGMKPANIVDASKRRSSKNPVTEPDGKGSSTTTGYDDMQLFDLFVMPWPNSRETRFRWGVGPYFIFPTSSTDRAGNGAWQIGPAGAFSYRGIPGLNVSGLLQQATSFAYTSSHSVPVASFTFQPMLSYQLGRDWYVKIERCHVDNKSAPPHSDHNAA